MQNKGRAQFSGTKVASATSVLLELENFDVIRFCTVDPMHNLFLGTSKKMFKVRNDLKLFWKSQLKEVEERINSIEVPSDIGRLPMRITSNSGPTRRNNGKTGHLFTQFSAWKVSYQKNISDVGKRLRWHANIYASLWFRKLTWKLPMV